MNDEELKIIFSEIKERLIALENRSKVDHYYRVSKDGKYLIHGTNMVDIKPIEGYIDKVLETKERRLDKVTEEVIDHK